jgi:non-canonical poly(A) RNA polymerase PAPD5/7
MIPHREHDPRVYLDSLEGTLEAHRVANRPYLIREGLSNDVNEQDMGSSRPVLDSKLPHDPTRKKQASTQGPFDNDGKPVNERKPRSRVLEYTGIAQPPKNEWEDPKAASSRRERRPWLAHLKQSPPISEHVHHYLSAEILAFEKYMNSTRSEEAAADKALSDVRRVIEKIGSDIKISTIGSRSTGLAMPLSDIDVSIGHPRISLRKIADPVERRGSPLRARKQAIDLLSIVRRRLKRKGGPNPHYTVPALVEAKVPIVRAQHHSTRLEIQIQCWDEGHASAEMVKMYMSEFPTLRPLYLVLRQVLKMRGLGEARRSGIGPYSLVMMIVATLRLSGSRFHRKDVARHLLYFLDFYTKIEFKGTGIAVDPPVLFPKRHRYNHSARTTFSTADLGAAGLSDAITTRQLEDHPDRSVHGRKQINLINKQRPYLMCLQDPADPFNDLGCHAAAIKHVQATFATLRLKIKSAMDLYESRTGGASFSLLEPLLAGNYRLFEKKRKRLQMLGEELMERPVASEHL